MIELSTTATFDRLFKELSSVIQRKAVTKTDLFKSNPFHLLLHTEKLHPKHHEVWRFRYIGHHHSIYDVNLFK